MPSAMHEHDCDKCKFLGTYDYGRTGFDLYHCPRDESFIARYGVKGNYISCPATVASAYQDPLHPIQECINRKAKQDKNKSS